MSKNIRKKILYFILLIELILTGYIIFRDFKIIETMRLSKIIEIMAIICLIIFSLILSKIIKKRFNNNKYSYGLVTMVGLLIFTIINTLRHIYLLVFNWYNYDKFDVYMNTLYSFSKYVILTLPCIFILAIFSIAANIVLIKKEGKKLTNILGIFIGFLVIIGLFGNQLIYILNSNLIKGDAFYLIQYISDIFLNSILVYFYSILLATIYCNVKVSRNIPKFDMDYIIILGCKIRKDGSLTPLLKGRVDKAIEFSKLQKETTGKEIIFIPSGGKGDDEVISEAEAMKNYLIEQGINKKNIIMEDKSKNTLENMKNSYNIIKTRKMGKVCFSTTNYHVFRSCITAKKCGIECIGMGSKTKWYFRTNAVIREFLADIIKDRKKHIIILVIIFLSAVLFVLFGYFNNLMRFD